MKSLFSYILFLIVLYMLLFDPPFFFFRGLFSVSNVIGLVSVAICFFKPKIFIHFLRQYRREFQAFLVLMGFTIIRSAMEGTKEWVGEDVVSMVAMFSSVPVLLYNAKKGGYGDSDSIIKSLLLVATIGATISLLCVISPPFNYFIKNDVIQYSEHEFLKYADYRGFGLAALLTSEYGFIMGALCVLGVFHLTKNRWFSFSLPFVFVAALINARTGALIAVIGSIIAIIFNKRTKMGAKVLPILVLVILTFSFEAFFNAIGFNERTVDWVMDFFEQGEDVAGAGGNLHASRQLDELLGKMWVLPETLFQWIFGRGFSLFRNTHNVQISDVGWILQLNYGGLIYLFMIIRTFYLMISRLYRLNQKAIAYYFMMLFLIINTKSSIYPTTGFMVCLMIIYYAHTSALTSYSGKQVKVPQTPKSNIQLSYDY